MGMDPSLFSQQPGMVQQSHTQQARAGPQTNDWASDFSRLNIGQQPAHAPLSSTSGWQDQFLQANAPQGFTQNSISQGPLMNRGYQGYTGPMVANTTASTQVNTAAQGMSKEAEAKLFEAAFANMEQQLNTGEALANTHIAPAPVVTETVQEEASQVADLQTPADENTELSKIAQHIVTNIDRRNEKLKNSNFMLLMGQLSQNVAKLDGEKFIDSVTGDDVRDQYMDADLQNELLQEQGKNEDELHDAPYDEFHQYNTNQPSVQDNLNIRNEGQRLPDPLDFINDMEDLEDISSSFQMAEKVVPNMSLDDWEERYD